MKNTVIYVCVLVIVYITCYIVKNVCWARPLLISSIMLPVLWPNAWRNDDDHRVHQNPVCTAAWKSLELLDIDGLFLILLSGFNWSDSVLY